MEPITCEQVRELLQDYADGELEEREGQGVAEHLRTCVRCLAPARFEAALLWELRTRLFRPPAPPLLLRKVQLALLRTLDDR